MEVRSCYLQDEARVGFSKQPIFWKIMWERMIGNVVISEVVSFMFVVLSEAEKHVPYGELVVTIESLTL
jgi:hypothetical protein